MRTSLVLARRAGEALELGDDVTVTVVSIAGGKVQLRIQAPKSLHIRRSEIAAHAPDPASPRRT